MAHLPNAEWVGKCDDDTLINVPGLRFLGPSVSEKAGIVSFTIDGLAASDIAAFLDGHGIAVREGHHCTLPLHKKLGISASVRASFYLYNTREEVEKLADSVKTTVAFFG